MFQVSPTLAKMQRINGYGDNDTKHVFQRLSIQFLKDVANTLGLQANDFSIRTNSGGPAVSGEVTLHSDTLYIQLQESCMSSGVGILYRSCRGRSDYTGGQNNWAMVTDLYHSERDRARFIERLKTLGGL